MAERKRPKTLMELADLSGPADWEEEDPRQSQRRKSGSGKPRKKTASTGGRAGKSNLPPKQRGLFFRLFVGLFWLGLGGGVLGVAGLVAGYAYFAQDLPPVENLLKNYAPPTVTYVYSDDGRVIGEYYHERRFVVPMDTIPDQVVKAFLAVEDADFYHHKGINPKAIIRAFIANWQAGRTVQGGSTITQQVAKTFLLSSERSYARKFKEMILSFRMEYVFSKEDILYLYLNQIYLGQKAYGVEAAARTYFDKSVGELTVAEAAILAGLVQAPGVNNPVRNPEKARERQLFAIRRMVDVGFITEQEAREASGEVIQVRTWWPNPNIEVAPYFTEHVRRLLEEEIGEDSLYNDGWKIYTTLNIEAQQAADLAVTRGLWEYARRRGYKGPDSHLDTENQIKAFLGEIRKDLIYGLRPDRLYRAVVMEVNAAGGLLQVAVGGYNGQITKKNMDWAVKGAIGQRFKRGDVIWVRLSDNNKGNPALATMGEVASALSREEYSGQVVDLILERQTDVQSALLSLDLANGDVKAMVGGRDFSESQFNRAVQSQRQPGSSFKPILYASAMEHGFTPGSVLIDAPVVIDDVGSRRRWKPVNADMKFKGPMTLFSALVASRNLISIKLLDRIGFEALEQTARELGITETLPRSLTLALGSHGLRMPELLSAYTAFGNMGQRVIPRYITRVEDRYGNVVKTIEPQIIPSLDPGAACAVTWMLRGVVEQGTGTVIKPLGRPVAAKTGTTNDYSDAWVVGFTPELATAVWVGTDQQRPRAVGEVGGRVAGPIFLYYMQAALKGKPITDFVVPPEAELAPGGSFGICYKAGTVGTGLSEVVGSGSDEEVFLKEDFEGTDDYANSFFSDDNYGDDLINDESVPTQEISRPGNSGANRQPAPVVNRTPAASPPAARPPAPVTTFEMPPSQEPPSGTQRERRPGDISSDAPPKLRTYGEEAADQARRAEEEARQKAEENRLRALEAESTSQPQSSGGPTGAADDKPFVNEDDFNSDEYLKGYDN